MSGRTKPRQREPELAGIREVANLLGVPLRTAHTYVNRDDFSAPMTTPFAGMLRGRVWSVPEVRAWAKQTLPLKVGRPPKRRDAK